MRSNRRRLGYLGLALLASLTLSSSAFAAKTVTPKTGTYEDPAFEGDTYQVVRMGRDRYGIKLTLVWVALNCGGVQDARGFYLREPKPIPIKNGKFEFADTRQETGAAGTVKATNEFEITGKVKSPTTIVGQKTVDSTLESIVTNGPPVREQCVGNEPVNARHQ